MRESRILLRLRLWNLTIYFRWRGKEIAEYTGKPIVFEFNWEKQIDDNSDFPRYTVEQVHNSGGGSSSSGSSFSGNSRYSEKYREHSSD